MQRVIPIKNVDEINLIKDYYRKKGELNYLLMFTLSINTGIDLSRLLRLKVKKRLRAKTISNAIQESLCL